MLLCFSPVIVQFPHSNYTIMFKPYYTEPLNQHLVLASHSDRLPQQVLPLVTTYLLKQQCPVLPPGDLTFILDWYAVEFSKSLYCTCNILYFTYKFFLIMVLWLNMTRTRLPSKLTNPDGKWTRKLLAYPESNSYFYTIFSFVLCFQELRRSEFKTVITTMQ